MNWLIPAPVVLPLLVGALFVGFAPVCPRRVADAIGIATAAICCGFCAFLAWRTASGTAVYWFGGWRPRGTISVGIAFVVDPLGAGAAAFAGGLMTAALVFAWHYFEAVRTYFHALMMIFLAGMTGFALTGDLFNQFVFFELMSATAYALTGYKVEDVNALEGAINFAVTNTVGAFLVLIGIALLYGKTGALNLAEVGAALRTGPAPEPLAAVALTLIFGGFFVKAAIVPFHLWLADAHAVAPTPVCVLFSGIMIELGLFGAFRVYETVFRHVPGISDEHVRMVLAAFGAGTAIVGAVMCLAQRHFKRLLAFSSVSHSGMILLGASTLAPKAIAGAALYVAGHGMIKGALFMCAGLLLHRLGGVDQVALHGRARTAPWVGVVTVIAALGLAGFPPFGTYVGKQLMEDAARSTGAGWVSIVFFAASALTSAAVLRFAGAVFLGWGRVDDSEQRAPSAKEERETRGALADIPFVMLGTTAVLAALPAALGLGGSAIAQRVERAAATFLDSRAYTTAVYQGGAAIRPSVGATPISAEAIWLSVGTVAVAIFLALFTLFPARWPRWIRRFERSLARPWAVLQAWHSGNVADYVTWVVVGVVALSVWTW